MKNRSAVRVGVQRLPVGEVAKILEALKNAKSTKHLDGRQRQHLDDACVQLSRAMERPVDGNVEFPVETAVLVMQCIAMTQDWLTAALAEIVCAELE